MLYQPGLLGGMESMRSKWFLLVGLASLISSPVSAIVISEIMYHPQTDELHNEWVELYNETAHRVDLSRWQFNEGIDYVFTSGTILQPRSYLVVARDPATIMARYGISNVVGPFLGALNNNSDHIILRDPAGGVMAEVDYDDGGKWPTAADGAGHSLAKLNLRGDPNDPDNWRASLQPGGTPGRDNGFPLAGPIPFPVVINEVCFNTSGTQFIELYNTSNAPLNIGRFYLSNNPDNLLLYQITTNTMIAARSRIAFLQPQLGFTMTSWGDRVLLTSPTANVVLDAREVDPGPKDWSTGRWPDGSNDWYNMLPTTGTANAVSLTTSVVINEIMYHPPTNNVADEYVELYNIGATPVSLAGWSLSDAIRFDFPTTASIGSHCYLVVAKDRNRLISRYSLSPSIVLGNTSGTLADGGDRIRLRDANHNIVNEVRYYDGGHWSEYADGYGSSLELIDPRQDNSNYQNWAPSDERSKAAWTQFTYSGVVNTDPNAELHELHLLLLGKGVALIDDVHLTIGATEYMANGGFESGIGNWLCMGTHVWSRVTSETAHSGSNCLKIITTASGDPGANHIEQDSAIPMPSGQTYTLSFWAKWQWGTNLLLTRIWNNQLQRTHVLPVPTLTGTPGTTNSAYRANLGPVFSKVSHSPVVPLAANSVTIRARVYDPDGVTSAVVYFKADADPAYIRVVMRDDGTGGDLVAGDGIYAATIPPRAAGQNVAFYLAATDCRGAVNTCPTDISRPADYRVESGAWSSNFPRYRVVMTAAELNNLFNRPHLSNDPVNCTFVFDEKEVYYNCGVVFTGSPYGRGGGGYRGYEVSFPSDNLLFGYKEARFDASQNGGYRDHLGYDMERYMGQPTCPGEFIEARVNGRNEGINEDLILPGRLYLDKFFRGDSGGQLLELSSRYEYTDNNDWVFTSFIRGEPTWQDWGNDKDVYRWNWRLRNHEREDDYTSMILAIRAVSQIPNLSAEPEVWKWIDVQQWARQMAVRAVDGDWDFFATRETKNCYFYFQPSTRKWLLVPWDNELGFYDNSCPFWASTVPQINRFEHFRAMEHYFLNNAHEYMAKYFTRAFLDPWIDHYFSLVGGQSAATTKSFIDQRRTNIQSQMAPYLLPATPCNIGNPDPLTVPITSATLYGTAPANVSWIRYQGQLYWPYWSDAVHWTIAIPVPHGSNLITLEFLDYDKLLVGTDSIRVTVMIPMPGSIVINSGATYTSSTAANLAVSASSSLPIYDMHFSNDGSTWTGWEPYATNKTWTLTGGNGNKTVYFQVRDGNGDFSVVYSDAIILDQTPPTGWLSINSGAASTDKLPVTLILSVSDVGSYITAIRFRNETGAWSAWEMLVFTKAWTLSPGNGIKTVYLQVMDAAGNVGTISDPIELRMITGVDPWRSYK